MSLGSPGPKRDFDLDQKFLSRPHLAILEEIPPYERADRAHHEGHQLALSIEQATCRS